jgi:uncharacterized membrane protein
MSDLAMASPLTGVKSKRIVSIDLLRGIVMILMVLDHVRDYFHAYSFQFDAVDLDHTSIPIFFTRWITHFCAPIFMFLSGISAYLYGAKRSRRELSFFLFTRGLWLALAELFIVTFGWTFNPFYQIFILQVIWAFGICMMVLSVLIYLDKRLLLVIGILLMAAHNLLDGIHVAGSGAGAVGWAFLHDQRFFSYPHLSFLMGYPIIPWIGIIVTGYCLGELYSPDQDAAKRRKTLLFLGLGAILLFVLLRFSNIYGDPYRWSVQRDSITTFLSFLRATKYPPSILYILMTLGPALVFLSLAEGRLNALTEKISVFGRVPMFYYLVHIFLIHLLAMAAAAASGYKWSDMVVTTWVTASPALKGYGFNLLTVYGIWLGTVILLYPLCKRYDRYKRAHQGQYWWLSYI